MTNPFLSNDMTARAKFVKDNAKQPEVIVQAIKDAGLSSYAEMYTPLPAALMPVGCRQSPVDYAIAARKFRDALHKQTESERLVCKPACDCNLGGSHERWCHNWKAYEAE